MLLFNSLYSFFFRFSLLVLDGFEIILYTIFVIFLTLLVVGISFLLAPFADNPEKSSGYECGFEPFADARQPLDIHFYLIGILFLIFDLEVVFLYPAIAGLWVDMSLRVPCIVLLLFFFFLLGVGFVYEWRVRALTWTPSF